VSDRSCIIFKRVLLGLGVGAILSAGQPIRADGPTARRNTQPTSANRFPPLPDIVARRAAADQKRERAGILTKLAYWTIEFGDSTSYETPLVVSPESMRPSALADRRRHGGPSTAAKPAKPAAKHESHVIIMPQDEQPPDVAPAVVSSTDDVANVIAPAVHEVADRSSIPDLPEQISTPNATSADLTAKATSPAATAKATSPAATAKATPADATAESPPARATASKPRTGANPASQIRSSRSSASTPVKSSQPDVPAGRTHDLEALAAQHEAKTSTSQKPRSTARQAGSATPSRPTPPSPSGRGQGEGFPPSSVSSFHDPNIVQTSATGPLPSPSGRGQGEGPVPSPPGRGQGEGFSPSTSLETTDLPPRPTQEQLEEASRRLEEALRRAAAISNDGPPVQHIEELPAPIRVESSLPDLLPADEPKDLRRPAADLLPGLATPPSSPAPAEQDPPAPPLDVFVPHAEPEDPEIAAVRRELAELALESRLAGSLIEDARRELEALSSAGAPLAIPRAESSPATPNEAALTEVRDELAALVELNDELSPAQQSAGGPPPADPGEPPLNDGAALDLAVNPLDAPTPKTEPEALQESSAAATEPEPIHQPLLPDPTPVALEDALGPAGLKPDHAAPVPHASESAAESETESVAKSVAESTPGARTPTAEESTPPEDSHSTDLVMPELESLSPGGFDSQGHTLPPLEEVQALPQPEIAPSHVEPVPTAVADADVQDAVVPEPAEPEPSPWPQSLPAIEEPSPLPDLPAEVQPSAHETTRPEAHESAAETRPHASDSSPQMEEAPLAPPAEDLAPVSPSAADAPPTNSKQDQVSPPRPAESPQPASVETVSDLSGPASGLRFARSLLERGDVASTLKNPPRPGQTKSSGSSSKTEDRNDVPSSLPPIVTCDPDAAQTQQSEQGVSLPPLPPAKRFRAPGEPAHEPHAAPQTNAAAPSADDFVRPASMTMTNAVPNPSIRLARPVADPLREVAAAEVAPQSASSARIASVAHWTGRSPELKKPVALGSPESVQSAAAAVRPDPADCLERIAAATHPDQRIRALLDLSHVDKWHQFPGATDAVLRIAASQADQPSRLLAIRMIGDAPRSTPNALPLLRGLARNDSNGFVRRAAQTVLIEQSSRMQPVAQ
jgi:hypothetical protein